jgi:hypothetical protein
MKTKLIVGLVVLSLVATTTGVVLARDNSGMQPPEGMQPPMMAQPEGQCDEMDLLTEEEREDIQQQMEEFRQELREQYGDNTTEEEREEMAQEMQNFWEQLCDQYNISCPNGYQYWAVDGRSINGTVGPERQMDEHRPMFGADGGNLNDTKEQERQRDESGLGLVAKWLGDIQTFFRNLIGV